MAEALFLEWQTVKGLDGQYMGEQLGRAGKPALRVIGLNEIASAKGYSCHIVIIDRERGRPV